MANQLELLERFNAEKRVAIIEKEQHFKNIYDKANRMLAVLCAEGDITANDTQVEELMSALADFDSGVWDTEKMFSGNK